MAGRTTVVGGTMVPAAKESVMSEEVKKEEEKKCVACLDVAGARHFGGYAFIICFLLALMVAMAWLIWMGRGILGFTIFFGVIWLALACLFIGMTVDEKMFGKCVYCFFDKAGNQHHHEKPLSTRLNAAGKTVYYFVPENAPSNAPLEDWDISGSILHLHFASWRSDSRVLNAEAGYADDLLIDRVKVVGEGEKSFISLRLRRRSWQLEAFVISAASALKIIGEGAVKSSLVEHLFERIKERQFWLDEASERLRCEEKSAENWKKVAVGSCARIRFTKELLDRFEAALIASKRYAKSYIAAEARIAVSRLNCSYVVKPLSVEEDSLLSDQAVEKLLGILLFSFDQSSFDVALLKKESSSGAVSIETPPAPTAQQA